MQSTAPSDVFANIDAHKTSLVASFRTVATSMRECANLAETFANYISALPTSNPSAFPSPYGFAQNPSVAGGPAPATGSHHATSKKDDAAADTGAKHKRTRKEKKPRDPNAPKRPPSAYLLYQNDVRKAMQSKFQGMPYHEVLGEISKTWASMPADQKKVYADATAAAKARYDEEKALYDASVANGTHGAAPTTAAKPAATDESEDESAAKSSEEEEEKEEAEEEEEEEESESDEDEDERPAAKKPRKEPKPATPPPAPPVVAAPSSKSDKKKKKETKKDKDVKKRKQSIES